MKISILNTFADSGGAAIAARRLWSGLRELQQDTVMIVTHCTRESPHLYCIEPQYPYHNLEKAVYSHIQKNEINLNRTGISSTWFSLPYPSYDISNLSLVRDADVINIHWIAGFLSAEDIAKLLELGKPVVWTMHDENPYTGGCHYTAGCFKYKEDCKDCPQLVNNRYQLPFHYFREKSEGWKNFKNLTIVTPSRWLAENARKSRLFEGLRVEVIPNSLETDVFEPIPKAAARKALGLPIDARLMLFGAYNDSMKRKGFYKLIEALNLCMKDENFHVPAKKSAIRCLTFGPPSETESPDLPIPLHSMGIIKDMNRLALLYSAADVFILPSMEDNLPNTMLEAMACGTPVIAFDVGGIPDAVIDNVTGFLVPPGDSVHLAKTILEFFFKPGSTQGMSERCRSLIEEKFKLTHQANAYLKLFNDILPGPFCKSSRVDGFPTPPKIFDKDNRKLLEVQEPFHEKVPGGPAVRTIPLVEKTQSRPYYFYPIYEKYLLDFLIGPNADGESVSPFKIARYRDSRFYRLLRGIAKKILHCKTKTKK